MLSALGRTKAPQWIRNTEEPRYKKNDYRVIISQEGGLWLYLF